MDNIKNKKKKKVTYKKKTKDKKGFTLIELLAVIIILGVLLLIAVPSISKYIDNSRKNTYINSVRSMVNAVSTAVNAQELPFTIGKGEGMIVPFSEIELEKKAATTKSPYSPWDADRSFILVVFDGDMYKYYVSAKDETGYGLPLVYEKSLTTDSITTDIEEINANCISHDEYSATIGKVFDTDVVTMEVKERSGKILKVKVGHSSYKNGDAIQLKDGSKWFAIKDSALDEDTVTLVSYYSMATTETNYGKQDSNNPKIRFHDNALPLNPAVYDSGVTIYAVAEQIVSATQVLLVQNNIDMNGAVVTMPQLSDFGCTKLTTGGKCNFNVKCFKGSETVSFWTTDTNGEWVYTIVPSGRGQSNSNVSDYGIRLVIKDLLKSNIDKKATKALN